MPRESDPEKATEWRHDYLTDRRVIIAGNRGTRPGAYAERMRCAPIERCPFCEGNEADSPIHVSSHRLPDSANVWDVRVVGNLFPALQLDTPLGFGKHEVIIESAQHEAQFGNLPVEQIDLALNVWRDRLRATREVPGIVHAMLFKNNGAAAGASLEHCHSQMLAMGIVPQSVENELQRCRDYRTKTGHSYFDDWREREKAFGKRIVVDSESFLVLCPEASRVPYEMVILPTRNALPFTEIDDNSAIDLAVILKQLLSSLAAELNDPDYNIIVHQAPFAVTDASTDYGWRLEIIPRITEDAGFEWGTGYAINSVPPEFAAERLCRRAYFI